MTLAVAGNDEPENLTFNPASKLDMSPEPTPTPFSII